MKLCSLRFKNLNSLAGEWRVNFEAPEYAGGLFAITGPTGAGKTTLLDAVCLALFGRTPRLDRVNASGNEIMTRGASECLAEVTFISGGVRYCASWSQKKAFRKGVEKLQPPKCRFSRTSPDEETIADSITGVSKAVEQICHLDFERFTRTVVLPQGGFAAFLQADGTSRARILEELTGAEVYRAISRKVYELTQREKEKLEQLRQAQSEQPVMSAEDRAAAEARLAESEKREAELNAHGEKLAAAHAWYARRRELEAKRAALAAEKEANDLAQSEFAPLAEKLNIAERAATLADFYDALSSLREKQKNTCEEEKSAATAAASAAGGAADAEAEALKAVSAFEELRAQADANADLWGRVTALDSELAACEKEFAQSSQAAAEQKEISEQAERKTERLRQELEDALAELPKLEVSSRAAAEALEKARDDERRADLSQLRAALTEGKPCPLCGSVHHPSPFAAQEEEAELFRLHENAERARTEASAADAALRGARETQIRLSAELNAQSAACDAARTSYDLARSKADAQREVCARKRAERAELFGAKDPAAEREAFQKEQASAEKRAARAREAETAAKIATARAQTEWDQRKQARAVCEAEVSTRETAFAERLQKLGFRDESEWHSAALDETERARLTAERDRLEQRARELAALLPQAEAELAAHGTPPEIPSDGLDEQISQCRAALTDLLTSRGADAEALQRDDERRVRLAELEQQEKAQEKRAAVWRTLCDHIGSAKGDQFSRYVQGLTFRRLVHAANVQLERLSERYRLRPGEDDALRLDVVDLWQGGQSRSCKSLSGGESFIVSLALALALSHGMKEVNVDSLFLDEGFGTLDEDSLETVLECLDRLRESGRLVGVISHVRLLQERIDCRIAVIPDGNGRSRLSGPGCEKKS